MRNAASVVLQYAPAAFFVLALYLRLIGLTYHSFWFDEAMSGYWAAQSPAEIWRVGLALVADRHPPLYYLLLHFWSPLFGDSDASFRILGAILGALAVFPAFGIGRLLGGRRAAMLGALLVAVNPFLVWYSQEVRMFMPATTFALAGLYGTLRLGAASGHRPSRWQEDVCAWLTTVAGFAAALYSYLYSAFLLPVAAAWVLLLAWSRRKTGDSGRVFLLGATALAVVALFFLPLALSAWRVSGAEFSPGRPFAGLWTILLGLLRIYLLGWPSWPAGVLTLITALFGVLAAWGLVVPTAGDVRRSSPGGLALAVWLAGVIVIGGFLMGRDASVFAEPRYQIALVPALCLAVGRALAWIWDRRRYAGFAASLAVLGISLLALRYDWVPENRREAWREIAEFVSSRAGPNDAVLIQADYLRVAYERYYHGPLPIFTPFTERVHDPARIDPPLQGLAGYDVVWLIQSRLEDVDPGNLVLGWFGARFPLVTEAYPTGIAIRGFDQHYRLAELPPGTVRLESREGDGGLLSCDHPGRIASAAEDLFHPPSAWIPVTTFWSSDSGAPAAGRPVVRLVDAQGQVWGESLARGNDVFAVWPPDRWQPGEVVRAAVDVNLNPITPPGDYRLIVEWPAGQAPAAECGRVTVSP